jgi:hypothetical protein
MRSGLCVGVGRLEKCYRQLAERVIEPERRLDANDRAGR